MQRGEEVVKVAFCAYFEMNLIKMLVSQINQRKIPNFETQKNKVKIAIVKYNAGNVFSVECALRRLGVEPVLTADPDVLRAADKVVFPGVGEASSAMTCLRGGGLDGVIRSLRQPVLGVCIGQQLMCRHSEEGDCDCLGIFDVDVKRFQPAQGFKIPEMGWNTVATVRQNRLLEGIADGSYVYYVHSYYAPVCADTIAVTEFAVPFSAAMQRDNFYATQFHPEKSGDVGSRILQNFLEL